MKSLTSGSGRNNQNTHSHMHTIYTLLYDDDGIIVYGSGIQNKKTMQRHIRDRDLPSNRTVFMFHVASHVSSYVHVQTHPMNGPRSLHHHCGKNEALCGDITESCDVLLRVNCIVADRARVREVVCLPPSPHTLTSQYHTQAYAHVKCSLHAVVTYLDRDVEGAIVQKDHHALSRGLRHPVRAPSTNWKRTERFSCPC